MNHLSPEEINRRHGRATWTCWGCKAATGLHWHNGWSVAMCGNPACAGKYDAMCAEQLESEERMRAYEEDVYGPSR